MKKIAFLSIIVVLLAGMAIPALAAGKSPHGNGNGGNAAQARSQTHSNNQHGDQAENNHGKSGAHGVGNSANSTRPRPFYLQGTIKSIDTGAKTLVVTVLHGNAAIKRAGTTDISIVVTDATLFYQVDQNQGEGTTGETPARTALTFDQLAVGQFVAIHGNLANGVFTARLVTVFIRPASDAETTTESTGDQP